MRLSNKVRHALAALLALTGRAAGAPSSAAALARDLAVPHRVLGPVLTCLRRVGLVRARRGRDGGYALAAALDRLTVLEVVRAIDPPPAPPRAAAPPPAGAPSWLAPVAAVEARLQDEVARAAERVLSATTLAGLRQTSLAAGAARGEARLRAARSARLRRLLGS